jgi:Ca2+-binding RTX toxin-like protein
MRSPPSSSMFMLRACIVCMGVLASLPTLVAHAQGPVAAAYVATYDTFEIENVTADTLVVEANNGTTQQLAIPAQSEIFVARGAGTLTVRYQGELLAIVQAGTSTAPPAPTCGTRTATIYEGQPGSVRDVGANTWSFEGTGGGDIVVGTDGTDIVNTGDGGDVLCGGDGTDQLSGGAGDDLVYVDGFDLPTGGSGFDTVDGTLSATPLSLDISADGFERAYGSALNDTLVASEQPDGANAVVIYGREGNDRIGGTSGADVLYGEAGLDELTGNMGADALNGGADDDVLFVDGTDTVVGGAGYDIADASTSASAITLNLAAAGVERVYGSPLGDSLTASGLVDSQSRVVVDGRAGDDRIVGSAGPDALYGGSGNDTLAGGAGDDIMQGGGEDDVLDGGPGRDVLDGDGGVDRLQGGADDDSVVTDGIDAVTTGGDGRDTFDPLDATAPVSLALAPNTFEIVFGTPGNDLFDATGVPSTATPITRYDAVMYGRGGDDTLIGSSFLDLLIGDSGNDTLDGRAGADALSGGAGDDTLVAAGDDFQLLGGTGRDTMQGDASPTSFVLDLGPLGIERAFGSPLNDTFTSITIPDATTYIEVHGGAGNDSITGSSGPDLLYGDAGDDKLFIDNADTVVEGGTGFDVADALAATASVTLDLGVRGIERAFGSPFADVFTSTVVPDSASAVVMYGRGGDDQMSGSSGSDTLFGEAGADTLAGNDGSDRLSGGDGADVLRGGNGPDALYGDADADALHGDGGNDTLYIDGTDRATGGTGNDLADGVRSMTPMTLDVGANGFERATGSAGNDTFTSSMRPDSTAGVTIIGFRGDDSISGSPGPDVVYGGDGADVLRGEAGDDQIKGEAGDDQIWGGAGADLLIGDAGADVLRGEADNDRVYPDQDDTTVRGGPGVDILRGEFATRLELDVGINGFERTYGSPGPDVFMSSVVPDGDTGAIIFGQGGNDQISGSLGPDTLVGGDGADVLRGEDGDDVFRGDAGPDAFSGGAGTDRIVDFVPDEDTQDGTVP